MKELSDEEIKRIKRHFADCFNMKICDNNDGEEEDCELELIRNNRLERGGYLNKD